MGMPEVDNMTSRRVEAGDSFQANWGKIVSQDFNDSTKADTDCFEGIGEHLNMKKIFLFSIWIKIYSKKLRNIQDNQFIEDSSS